MERLTIAAAAAMTDRRDTIVFRKDEGRPSPREGAAPPLPMGSDQNLNFTAPRYAWLRTSLRATVVSALSDSSNVGLE